MAHSPGWHDMSELNEVNKTAPYSRRLEAFRPHNIRILRDIPPTQFGWTPADIAEYGEDDFLHLEKDMVVQLINFGGVINVGHFPHGSGSGEAVRDYARFVEGVDFEFV